MLPKDTGTRDAIRKTRFVDHKATMNQPKIKRDPEGTRRRILLAAAEEFAAGGLFGARVDQIARRAETNERMLYYYFGSKERLHRAVLENLLGELTAIYQSAGRASCGPAARLLLLVNAYFDFLVSHPNYPRLMQRQVMQSEFDWIARRYFVRHSAS